MNDSPRIASLLSSATEILYALGLGHHVVAVSHECDYPAEARRKPQATRSRVDSRQPGAAIDRQVRQLLEAGQPLYEVDGPLLARLRPQVVVTQAQCDVCAVRYEDVVETVRRYLPGERTSILALQPNQPEDVLRDVERVGEAVGASAAARRVVEQLERRIEAVRRVAGQAILDPTAPNGPAIQNDPSDRSNPSDGSDSGSPSKASPNGDDATGLPRVVCLEWLDPLMVAGNWTPRLLDWAGAECRLAQSGRHSQYVAWETVRQYDPRWLIIAPCGFDLERSVDEARNLPRLPGWSDLSAVRDGRVFALDGNAYLNRSGPRLVTTLEILAHLLRPHAIEPPLSPEERRQAFCRLETRDGHLHATRDPGFPGN